MIGYSYVLVCFPCYLLRIDYDTMKKQIDDHGKVLSENVEFGWLIY